MSWSYIESELDRQLNEYLDRLEEEEELWDEWEQAQEEGASR